jgi:hypothetical protein
VSGRHAARVSLNHFIGLLHLHARPAIRPWLTFKKTGAIQRSPKNDRMTRTMTIKPTM